MTLRNKLLDKLLRSAKSCLVSALFSSLTLYPAGVVAAQQIKTVTLGPVERSDVVDQIAVVGTLVARDEIRVNALVQGKEIREILAEVGAVVAKGQPLALLDTAEAQLLLDRIAVQHVRASAAVAQEHSRVEVAAVTERETRKIIERSRSLVAKGVVSQQIVDEHENAFSRARSQLDLARQSLMLAEADRKLIERQRAETALTIERSTVRATEAGLILSREARVGAMTSSSGAPLFIIAQDGLIEMEASVSETSFVRLREGMPAQVKVPGIDRPVDGKVRLSAAQIDPATRMGTVRLELYPIETLVAGAFAHGRIEAGRRSNIVIPATAVRTQDGGASVFVVAKDQAILRSVTLGSQQGKFIEILEGLRDGELVVIKASSFLKTDEKIEAVLVSVSKPGDVSSADLAGSVAR